MIRKLALGVILLAMLAGCGDRKQGSQPSPPGPAGLTKLVWNPFTTNVDGSTAQVDGYIITCEQAGTIISTQTSGPQNFIELSSLALSNDGVWCCSVQAFNSVNETTPSAQVCFTKAGSLFMK